MAKETSRGIDGMRLLEINEEAESYFPHYAEFVADGVAEIWYYQRALCDYQIDLVKQGQIAFPLDYDRMRAFSFRTIPFSWKLDKLTNAEIDKAAYFLSDNYPSERSRKTHALDLIGELSPDFAEWVVNHSKRANHDLLAQDILMAGITTTLPFHLRELTRMSIGPDRVREMNLL